MKKIIIALALTLAPIAASAEENLYLNLGGFSKHFKERHGPKDYNEVNNNIGLEFEKSLEEVYSKKWYAGALAQYMKNSLDNDSFVAAATLKRKFKLSLDSNIGIGVAAGIQNGYPKAGERSRNAILPVAYPYMEYNYDRVGVYGTCVPQVYASGFCFVGFKVKVAELD